MTEANETYEVLRAPSGTEEPAEDPPKRRTGMLGHVLVAVAAVFVVGAVVAGIVGLSARSEAEDAQERAAQLAQVERTQEQAEEDADGDRERLEELADTMATRGDELGNAFPPATDAHNRFAEMTDRGADVFNNGDVAGSEVIFRDEGSVALEELRRTQATVNEALAAFHDARDELEEAVR